MYFIMFFSRAKINYSRCACDFLIVSEWKPTHGHIACIWKSDKKSDKINICSYLIEQLSNRLSPMFTEHSLTLLCGLVTFSVLFYFCYFL